jgi:REP element-mobilizing transposase RayT
MVAGYHLIWTAYGWWLPNDPRGSTSRGVAVKPIAQLGPHHFGRKVDQPSSREIREFYDRAEKVLKHQLLTFDDEDIECIACGFARTIQTRRYTCYACAIMPDHVHVLIRKHRDKAEQMIDDLQQESRCALVTGERRAADHPVWGGPGWKVFQNSQRQIETTIEYIRQNPMKIDRPVQEWGFVKKYDGWLPGSPFQPRR